MKFEIKSEEWMIESLKPFRKADSHLFLFQNL